MGAQSRMRAWGESRQHFPGRHSVAVGRFTAAVPKARKAAPGMKSECIISISLPLPRRVKLLVFALFHAERLSRCLLRLGQELGGHGGCRVLWPLPSGSQGFCHISIAVLQRLMGPSSVAGALLGTDTQMGPFRSLRPLFCSYKPAPSPGQGAKTHSYSPSVLGSRAVPGSAALQSPPHSRG